MKPILNAGHKVITLLERIREGIAPVTDKLLDRLTGACWEPSIPERPPIGPWSLSPPLAGSE